MICNIVIIKSMCVCVCVCVCIYMCDLFKKWLLIVVVLQPCKHCSVFEALIDDSSGLVVKPPKNNENLIH